jgi:hypothetical protein
MIVANIFINSMLNLCTLQGVSDKNNVYEVGSTPGFRNKSIFRNTVTKPMKPLSPH